MRGCLAVALALTISGHASAQEVRLDRVELMEAGSYKAKGAWDSATISDVHFYSNSTRVFGRVGGQFGVRFRVVGSPDGAPINFLEVWHLPLPGAYNPDSKELVHESRVEFVDRIGALTVRGLILRYESEIVSGDWTYELWSGARKLLSQTFTMDAP